MANKRIIISGIFEDEFFGNLTMMPRVLWIGLFARCADDQGRMADNATVIRSQIFPYDDIPVADINAALAIFAEEKRIIRYQDGRGRHYIQLVKWWENQAPQWAGRSNYPAPEGWTDRVRLFYKGQYICENWPEKEHKPKVVSPPEPQSEIVQVDSPGGQTRWTPGVDALNLNLNHNLNLNLNQIKYYYQQEPEKLDIAIAEVSKLYEREIGLITQSIADELKDAIQEYPLEWFEVAINESALHNKRNWKYIRAILRRWKVEGFSSPKARAEVSATIPSEVYE